MAAAYISGSTISDDNNWMMTMTDGIIAITIDDELPTAAVAQ
jgi:hypothetical protein